MLLETNAWALFLENGTQVPLYMWETVLAMVNYMSDLFDYNLVARGRDLTIWAEDVL